MPVGDKRAFVCFQKSCGIVTAGMRAASDVVLYTLNSGTTDPT